MIRLVKKYILLIGQINEIVGKAASWLVVMLVSVMCFDVIRRYLFNTTTVAFIEMEWYLFAMIFLLSAGYTLKHDKHVRVDVFYSQFSVRNKAWVDFIGGLVFLIPFCLIIIYASIKYTMVSLAYNEGSPDSGGLPARYLIKAMIPLGFLFLLLQATASVLHNLLTISGHVSTKNTEQS